MKGNYISYYLPTVIENEMKYILFSPPPPSQGFFPPLGCGFFSPLLFVHLVCSPLFSQHGGILLENIQWKKMDRKSILLL